MAEKEKRYYWLKLKEGFFDEKEIKKLRRIAGGDTYTIIYLKLLLVSLRDNGRLFFDGVEETFAEELALMLDEDTENVKVTISYLMSVGLMKEVNPLEAEMTRMPGMIGSESYSAERMRRHRERQKALEATGNYEKLPEDTGSHETLPEEKASHCYTSVTDGDEEIDIDINSDIEKDTEKRPAEEKTFDVQQVIDAWNELPATVPRLKALKYGTNRYKMLKARITDYGFDAVLRAIDLIRRSPFLLGQVKNFKITFDWFIKPNNFIKVYEGNYTDSKTSEEVKPKEDDGLGILFGEK